MSETFCTFGTILQTCNNKSQTYWVSANGPIDGTVTVGGSFGFDNGNVPNRCVIIATIVRAGKENMNLEVYSTQQKSVTTTAITELRIRCKPNANGEGGVCNGFFQICSRQFP